MFPLLSEILLADTSHDYAGMGRDGAGNASPCSPEREGSVRAYHVTVRKVGPISIWVCLEKKNPSSTVNAEEG